VEIECKRLETNGMRVLGALKTAVKAFTTLNGLEIENRGMNIC
jgi:hypothetical protein